MVYGAESLIVLVDLFGFGTACVWILPSCLTFCDPLMLILFHCLYVQVVSECHIGESCLWRRNRRLEGDKLDRCTRKSVRCLHFRLSYHQGELYLDASAHQSLTLDYPPRVQSSDANATTVTDGQCYLGMGYICFCSREHHGNPAVANS